MTSGNLVKVSGEKQNAPRHSNMSGTSNRTRSCRFRLWNSANNGGRYCWTASTFSGIFTSAAVSTYATRARHAVNRSTSARDSGWCAVDAWNDRTKSVVCLHTGRRKRNGTQKLRR